MPTKPLSEAYEELEKLLRYARVMSGDGQLFDQVGLA